MAKPKFTLKRDDLHGALSKIAVALENKDELEAYTLLALEFKADNLILSAANKAMSTQACVPVTESSGDLSFCASGNILKNIVASLPSEEVSFVPEETTVRVKTKKSNFKINVKPIQDFPPMRADYSFIDWTEISYKDLLFALKKVEFSTGDGDQVRESFKGVFVDNESFAATDGHRISIFSNKVLPVEKPIIVPNGSVSRLLKLYRGMGESGGFCAEENSLHFVNDGVFASTALLAGKVPAYRSVIPSGDYEACMVPRKDLLEGVKRVLIMSHKNRTINLKVSKNQGEVVATGDAGKARESFKCKVGGDHNFWLNGKYLSDVLERMEGEEVLFELRPPTKRGDHEVPTAIVVREGDKDKEGEYTNVILPLRPPKEEGTA